MAQLTESSVLAYLCARGLVPAPDGVRVSTLAGGVSGSTFLVEDEDRRLVVKQPLAFLAVSDHWPARQERAGVEAAAIAALERLTPAALPRLVDYDPARFVITMTAARPGWQEWRQRLLTGAVDVAAGHRLGEVLGTWHAQTAGDNAARAPFGDHAGFIELRGEPYHRTVAQRRPELAGAVSACLEELLGPAECLVHGDFSPKNVLVAADGAPSGLWVLDFEVAHAGNPVFDVAFMLHHLVMKAIHLPATAVALRRCAEAFVAAYHGAGGRARDESALVRHTGALLLARVHGKSPASYLTTQQAEGISAIGADAVHGRLTGWTDFWEFGPRFVK